MRYYDAEEVHALNAEPWQIDLLQINPSYCSWGPHEDYMWNEGTGWSSRVIIDGWDNFDFELNDLNECVNFYFEVSRASEECPLCGGNGYHADAQKIVRTFYRHSCQAGEQEWCENITEDEAAALVEAGRGRLDSLKTAADFNAAQRKGGLGGHDAINRFILIDARLNRLGITKNCETCDGSGFVYTAPAASVSLVLWWLHPRKGCSRGIEITNIRRSDLLAIQRFLSEAAERNATRFSAVGNIAAQGIEASGGDGTAPSRSDESPVRKDAP